MDKTWIWLLAILFLVVCRGIKLVRVPLLSEQQCVVTKSVMKINFFGVVEIGTPPVEYKMLFDSGSTIIWVSAQSCSSIHCQKRIRYDPSLSSTSKSTNQPFRINYARYTVKGTIWRDNVVIAGVTMKDHPFLVVTEMADPDFIYKGYDGIVGLSSKYHPEWAKPVLDYMYQKKLIHRPVFSVYLKRNPNCFGEATAGTVVLGGSDAIFGNSLMNSFPTTANDSWEFEINSVADKDGVYCEFFCKGLLHTAFPYNGFPPGLFQQLIKKFYVISIVKKEVIVNCNMIHHFPKIEFRARGATFTLDQNDYVFKEVRNGSLMCIAGFQENDLWGDGTFVLGNAFIRKYYTEFDDEYRRIGMGLSRQFRIIML